LSNSYGILATIDGSISNSEQDQTRTTTQRSTVHLNSISKVGKPTTNTPIKHPKQVSKSILKTTKVQPQPKRGLAIISADTHLHTHLSNTHTHAAGSVPDRKISSQERNQN